MNYIDQLSKMNDEFDNLMVQFESEYSIEKIVDVVKKIPVELREKSINQYQIIIRKNNGIIQVYAMWLICINSWNVGARFTKNIFLSLDKCLKNLVRIIVL